MVEETHKKDFAIGKLKNKLKEAFIVKITDNKELDSNFKEYYKSYIEDLVSKANIQTDIK